MLYALVLTVVAFASCTAFLAIRSRTARLRRAQLIARIQQGEAAQVLLQVRAPYAGRARRARYAMQRRSRRLTIAGRRRDALSHHAWHGARWSFGFVLAVLLSACLWASLFVLQRDMDINVLAALGYASPSGLGMVVALVFAGVGMIVSGLLGLHPLLPAWIKSAGRLGRITTALMLAAVSITFMAYLRQLAVDRSVARFSAEVAELQTRLQHTSGATPAEQVTRAALANAQERLSAGKSLDHSLTMTVLTLEMTFSAAPILAVELAVVGYYALAASRADRSLDAARRTLSRAREDFNGYAVGLLAEAGEPITRVQQRLAELPELDAERPLYLDGHHPLTNRTAEPDSAGPAEPTVPTVPAESPLGR